MVKNFNWIFSVGVNLHYVLGVLQCPIPLTDPHQGKHLFVFAHSDSIRFRILVTNRCCQVFFLKYQELGHMFVNLKPFKISKNIKFRMKICIKLSSSSVPSVLETELFPQLVLRRTVCMKRIQIITLCLFGNLFNFS